MKALKVLGLVLLMASPLLSQPPGPPISPGSSGGSGTVTGPGAPCVDNQIARWDGATTTALQCSVLTVDDTTGNITAPGALKISTAASDGDITLDPHGTGSVIATEPFKITDGSGTWNITVDSVTNTGLIFSDGFARLNIWAGYGLIVPSTSGLIWASIDTSSLDPDSSTLDLALRRDAAGTLAQRVGTNQQTFRLYNTYTDSSNYERLSLSGTAGSSVNITAETAGTGGDNLDITLDPSGTGSVIASEKLAITTGATTWGIYPDNTANVGIEFFAGGSSIGFLASAYGFNIPSSGRFGWTNATTATDPDDATLDLAIYRDAAATLAQRNSTNQQTFRLYNTYTDASNYERLSLSGVAGTSVNITAETAGTGGDDLSVNVSGSGVGTVNLTRARIVPSAAPPMTCAAGTEGALYVDSDTHKLCYCNGSGWVLASDDSTGCS